MATTLKAENREYVPTTMEEVPCMMCGSGEFDFHERIGHRGKFRYVSCRSCSNVFLNPRPRYDEEYLETAYSLYDEDHGRAKDDALDSPEDRKLIERHGVTLAHLEGVYAKGGKILDVGCCTGHFLLAAKSRGWIPFGIDISASMVDFVRDVLRIPVERGQFHLLDMDGWAPFDVIHCSHVIEHVPNPIEWMETFRKYVHRDGIVVINVPNHYSPEKSLQRFLKRAKLKKGEWAKWRTPDHLYEPHFKSMKYLFDKTGFEILEYFTYSSREGRGGSALRSLYHKGLRLGSKHRYFLKAL